ncbi:MAG: hypothetical protein GYA38_09095 [Chloroflexi bacterium]|jgi:hypothetical protein|nr:hypothetical protein [Chloroflexota bacterium]
MDLRFTEIPKITNDVLFEELVKDIITADPSFDTVNLNGRKGQGQNGVDIYARYSMNPKWIGIQCKVRSTNKSFTKKELLKEINSAQDFNPIISEFYIYTTLSRDTNTQKHERELNVFLRKNNSFVFQIIFWDDIADRLRQKFCETLYYRYYHKYFKDNLVLGHSIGKLVNLDLQFDRKFDTHYELIIGKIPLYKTEESTQVNYYRGTYFIINLNDKKMETFLKDEDSNIAACFPSDIEYAFNSRIDCYRICEWLKSIVNIDDFIYDDNHDYQFSITEKERQDYFKDL